jgi:hypothetical protein
VTTAIAAAEEPHRCTQSRRHSERSRVEGSSRRPSGDEGQRHGFLKVETAVAATGDHEDDPGQWRDARKKQQRCVWPDGRGQSKRNDDGCWSPTDGRLEYRMEENGGEEGHERPRRALEEGRPPVRDVGEDFGHERLDDDHAAEVANVRGTRPVDTSRAD